MSTVAFDCLICVQNRVFPHVVFFFLLIHSTLWLTWCIVLGMQIVCVCSVSWGLWTHCILYSCSITLFQKWWWQRPVSCPGLNPGSSYSGIRGISTQALSFHVDPGFALVTMKQLISHLNFKVLCIVSSKTKLSLTFVELGWRQKAWQSCLIAWNHWKRKRQC